MSEAVKEWLEEQGAGKSYELWQDDLFDNTTDPSVPLLATLLSDPGTTKINTSDENLFDFYFACNSLNNFFDEYNLSSQVGDFYRDFGSYVLYSCIPYTNVTRTINAGLDAPELVEALKAWNVTGDPDSVRLGEETAINIAEVMESDCKQISCGRKKAGEGENNGEEKMSAACELRNLYVNGTRGAQDTLRFDNAFQCRNDICNRARHLMKADADIGGASVFISYVLQTILCVVMGIYLLFKLSSGIFRKESSRFRPKHQHIRRQRSIEAHPAFERTLYNFTRVQAWFVVSLIISGSIRNYTHNISDVDEYLLVSIALNGIVMISFTLLAVHELMHKWSPTTIGLSATAYLATAIFYVIFVNNRSNTLSDLWNSAWYCTQDELGNIRSTVTFLRRVASVPAGIFWLVLIFCTFIEFGVILFQCVPRLEEAWRRQARWLRMIVYSFVIFMYLGILVLMFFLLASFFKVTNFKEWGFGYVSFLCF